MFACVRNHHIVQKTADWTHEKIKSNDCIILIKAGQYTERRLQKNKNNGFKKKQECGNTNSGNKRHQNTQAEILSGFSFMKLPVFIRIILNGSRVNHRTKEIRDRKKGVIRPTAARPSMPTVLAAITDGEDFGPLPRHPGPFLYYLPKMNEPIRNKWYFVFLRI